MVGLRNGDVVSTLSGVEAMTDNCLGCKFFLLDKNPNLGLCRRFPPIWTSDKRGFEFPAMKTIGWCGEHQPREKADKE